MDSTSMAHGAPRRGDVEARRAHVFARARATTGFMPDDEGEALFLAARRAGSTHPCLLYTSDAADE